MCAKYSWAHQLLVSDECWFIHCWVRSWRCNSNANWLMLQLMDIKPTWRSQMTNVPNFHKKYHINLLDEAFFCGIVLHLSCAISGEWPSNKNLKLCTTSLRMHHTISVYVAILFVIYGAHMIILFIVIVKIIFLMEWSYMSPPIRLISGCKMINKFWAYVQSLLNHTSFWCLFLIPHLITRHSNKGVCLRWVVDLGMVTSNYSHFVIKFGHCTLGI